MKKLFRVLLLSAIVGSAGAFHELSGQDKEGMVKYTPDFRFTDGIYLNFDQVKNNRPIPKG